MTKSREQTLVDVMFEIGVKMQMGMLKFQTMEECADYIADQLRGLGFDTKRSGMSWGVLQ